MAASSSEERAELYSYNRECLQSILTGQQPLDSIRMFFFNAGDLRHHFEWLRGGGRAASIVDQGRM